MIVLASTLGAGLSMVRDTGGKPEEFTTLDQAAHEASHRLPHFLPDGSGVLFTVIPFSAVGAGLVAGAGLGEVIEER